MGPIWARPYQSQCYKSSRPLALGPGCLNGPSGCSPTPSLTRRPYPFRASQPCQGSVTNWWCNADPKLRLIQYPLSDRADVVKPNLSNQWDQPVYLWHLPLQKPSSYINQLNMPMLQAHPMPEFVHKQSCSDEKTCRAIDLVVIATGISWVHHINQQSKRDDPHLLPGQIPEKALSVSTTMGIQRTLHFTAVVRLMCRGWICKAGQHHNLPQFSHKMTVAKPYSRLYGRAH